MTVFLGQEAVAEPAPRGSVPTDVGEPPVTAPVRGTKRHLVGEVTVGTIQGYILCKVWSRAGYRKR